MGEVYRARDARLGRDVAIKILPQHLSSNPQLRERFDREARAISSLNHPRICTLYDVGHQDGVDFLVMEYLEGESLADRLRRSPIPLKETLRIGMEVCEALDTAHRARIIHRDLKPGNIMLTKGGAKLMDFGLAKAALAGMASEGAAAPLLSAAKTISGISPISPLTTAGELLGTIQYMSPEQLEGKEADARSDIFGLGAVLYEMVTGKRPFDGKSQISVASAILEKDPEPISAIQPLTPPSLERVVKTCLEKNPDDRFQSARDVRLELKWIGEGAAQSPSIRLHDISRDGRVLLSRESWRSQLIGFFPGDKDIHPYSWLDNTEPTAITSDGRTVSFVEEGEVWAIASEGQCYVRATNGSAAVSYGAGETAISPDGKSVIVLKQQESKMELQPVGAGESRDLSTPGITQYDHISWSDDGRFIAYEGETTQQDWNVYLQEVAGGSPRLIQGGSRNSFPKLSPDGRMLALRLERKGVLLNKLDGSQLVPLSTGHEKEYPVRFTGDGKSLLVAEPTGHEVIANIVNLADGRRTPWKQFKSEGSDASRFVVTPDLKYYAFAVPRYSSVLNIVSGLH